MKIIFALVAMLLLSYSHASLLSNSASDSSSATDLLQNLIKSAAQDPQGAMTMMNSVMPIIKAFANSADSSNNVGTYTYEWCLNSGQGYNIFCVDLTWSFFVGWRANQFTDEKRLYNLTVVPYAYMDVIANFITSGDPIRLEAGPVVRFVHFQAPFSFEFENQDTLCYESNIAVDPISIDAGLGASFLECEIMIPEDKETCNWTNHLAARFFNADLNDGYYSSFLDRT